MPSFHTMQYAEPVYPRKLQLNMFFINADNIKLKIRTDGDFPQYEDPVKSGYTHPILIHKNRNNMFWICPCSRSNWKCEFERSYIEKNTVTDMNKIIKYRTYLVEEHSFPVVDMKEVKTLGGGKAPLLYWGKINSEDIA